MEEKVNDKDILTALKQASEGFGSGYIGDLYKDALDLINRQKAEIERLTEERNMYADDLYWKAEVRKREDFITELTVENAELQKKVENQKAVIVGQAKRIEKEKTENKRMYDEFVRLDDFCATKGCICCVCENKKVCKECSKCESLKTEKCNNFKIDVSKYTRAIERVEKLQKQVDELKEKIMNLKSAMIDRVARKSYDTMLTTPDDVEEIFGDAYESEFNKFLQQTVKDTAKEILHELLKWLNQSISFSNGKSLNGSVQYGAMNKAYHEVKRRVKKIAESKGVEVE